MRHFIWLDLMGGRWSSFRTTFVLEMRTKRNTSQTFSNVTGKCSNCLQMYLKSKLESLLIFLKRQNKICEYKINHVLKPYNFVFSRLCFDIIFHETQ